jgi:hypothetical protein
MRHAVRMASLGTMVSVALLGVLMAPAAQAGFGVAKFEAGTCNGTEIQVKECEYTSPHSAFFTQAAGHPPWGLTGVELAHKGTGGSRIPEGAPLKRLRVDVPPGLAADPQTLETCTRKQFNEDPKLCPKDSEAGFVELEAVVEVVKGFPLLAPPLTGKVYNLDQEPGLPLLFGIAVEGTSPIVSAVHLILEGHVSWAKEPALEARGIPSGDFHEYFEINNIPPEVEVLGGVKSPLETLKSKLFFNGQAGKGNFLTLPSECGTPSNSISYVEIESDTGEIASPPTVPPPVGIDGCGKNVPFEPITEVTPQTPQYDQPDGARTVVTVPQNDKSDEINTADIAEARATFPEGLTLNPSAAHGLEACSPAKIHFESKTPAECPAGSNIGKVKIETDLPPGSLTGSLYLGAPKGLPITGPPYTVYVVAESAYDVAVKLEGTIQPDASTGRLTADFKNTAAHPFNLPQLPFSSVILELNAGPRAPLANPLNCGSAKTESDFIAYSGEEILKQFRPSFPFPTTGCPNPVPFVLTQSTQGTNTTAGAYSPYTVNLGRTDGQQYLSRVSTTLPTGLLAAIPSVPLCGEPQAATGTCGSTSQVGVATVTAGAGTEPYAFSGPVFLTGPYNGAPYGLSIPVQAVAGPFNLGLVVTRAMITVDPSTARVIVSTPTPGTSGALPSIVGGVPLRLRSISVAVNRPNFIFNPTNCGALATDSSLTSTFGATQGLSSPFQAANCSALAFSPKFSASSSAKTSIKSGASLNVKITQAAHQSNLHEVVVALPKQLPARLRPTLQHACTEAQFASNPYGCPKESEAGQTVVTTPVLPHKLAGPDYFVSHGGAAFPDLDMVLNEVGPKGEVIQPGVRVILVGHTNISKLVTTSTFNTIPDAPVSTVEVTLPMGPHSALSANGSFCKKSLLMPTQLVGQGGKKLSQTTKIAVLGCPVLITKHKVKGHIAKITIKVPGAGRVTAGGKDLKTVKRKLGKAKTIMLKVPLSKKGLAALGQKGKLKIKLRVGFVPKAGHPTSKALVVVTFKR